MDWNLVSESPKRNGLYLYCYEGTSEQAAFEAEYKNTKWIVRDKEMPWACGDVIITQDGDFWGEIIDVKEAN